MTPGERAKRLCERIGPIYGGAEEVIEELCAAIAEEREACAQIAAEYGLKSPAPSVGLAFYAHECDWEECCAQNHPPKIAAAIRARC